MRLIDVTSMKLVEFFDDSLSPRYGILSHRWGSEELSFQDFQKVMVRRHPGYEKIKKFCDKVAKEGLQFAWVDTCCIDKTSSAELSEAINSMFTWYQNAASCFVYLEDVRVKDLKLDYSEEAMSDSFSESEYLMARDELFRRVSQSVWFSRGWTLQELLAPRSTRFYDAEWRYFGTKSTLEAVLVTATGIEREYLSGSDIETASVAKRMSWASKRVTTRVEDMAYCLLGLFGVHMPLLYGEGMRAFTRLQEEIMKDSADQTLFAWSAQVDPHESASLLSMRGPFALSPQEFADASNVVPYPDLVGNPPYAMTNQGLRIDIPTLPHPVQAGFWLAILSCHFAGNVECPLAIIIQSVDSHTTQGSRLNQYGRFMRPTAPIPVTPEMLGSAETRTIYLKKNIATATSHDKEYSFHLTVTSTVPKIDVELLNYAPFGHWQKQIMGEQYLLYASTETDSTIVRATFGTKDGERFVVGLILEPPRTFVHGLDKWLRTRCICKVVAGHQGSLENFSLGSLQKYAKRPFNDTQRSAVHITGTMKVVAEATKDFKDGGKVVRLNVILHGDVFEPFELPGDEPMTAELAHEPKAQRSIDPPDQDGVQGEVLQAALQGVENYAQPPSASDPSQKRTKGSKAEISTALMTPVVAQREALGTEQDDAVRATVLARRYFRGPGFIMDFVFIAGIAILFLRYLQPP